MTIKQISRRDVLKYPIVAGAMVGLAGIPKATAQIRPSAPGISGTVRFNDETPAPNVEVYAIPHNDELDILFTETDGNGNYSFPQAMLYPGENLYHIIFRKEDNETLYSGDENFPFIHAQGPVQTVEDFKIVAYDGSTGMYLIDENFNQDTNASVSNFNYIDGYNEVVMGVHSNGEIDSFDVSDLSTIDHRDRFDFMGSFTDIGVGSNRAYIAGRNTFQTDAWLVGWAHSNGNFGNLEYNAETSTSGSFDAVDLVGGTVVSSLGSNYRVVVNDSTQATNSTNGSTTRGGIAINHDETKALLAHTNGQLTLFNLQPIGELDNIQIDDFTARTASFIDNTTVLVAGDDDIIRVVDISSDDIIISTEFNISLDEIYSSDTLNEAIMIIAGTLDDDIHIIGYNIPDYDPVGSYQLPTGSTPQGVHIFEVGD